MKISSPITKAYAGPPRRVSGVVRYIISALSILALVFYIRQSSYILFLNPTSYGPHHYSHIHPLSPLQKEPNNIQKKTSHPIDELIQGAEKKFEHLLAKRSFDLKTAAAAYREKRGRHPPPAFDVWFKYAQSRNAIIVEDFFDQIYNDLAPFWGIQPSLMRKKADSYEMKISIRNHVASTGSDWFWTQIWLDMIKTLQDLLPDMDIALNAMDEPRIVVPWDEMNEMMDIEREKRLAPPAADIISNFSTLQPPGGRDGSLFEWETEKNSTFWEIAIRACHPDSPARKATVVRDFSHPKIDLQYVTHHSYKGYVFNVTAAADFCNQPDLQTLHGIMIKPLSISSTKDLFPMFGGSKLHTNSEILLPAPIYWSNEERFSGGTFHGGPWETKLNQVVWRGVATGGRNTVDNWRGFQRHRFVAMTNGTKISAAENWNSMSDDLTLPPLQYNLAAQKEGKMGEWTKKWADTGFVDLNCTPQENQTCYYTSPHFSLVPGMMMGDQFQRKFLPDIDGNSFSGRYRGFLRSTSLPIKATIFREWHDCRLVPWKHFVPMDNRFLDFWGIMQYFLGYESDKTKVPSHDEQAKNIALNGQEWANKVLRTEDMQIYVLRLLLEYARVSDDRRDNMGWVEDII
ncbi:Beta-1,2-xylosyltransferase 1 [Erysiphe necator]|uniref:Putative glycosyltransferase family 90 protein n=1 Tax=Uncinula necator TaxID=52586 RepID=A0A0B1P2N0_UNCNE|nr:Beta-1,2-xylosyltransferase 1 [Erysiphe necator]KHJ32937.1 putative glycosyltransferase family 90 protein [Erysiphe necator]